MIGVVTKGRERYIVRQSNLSEGLVLETRVNIRRVTRSSAETLQGVRWTSVDISCMTRKSYTIFGISLPYIRGTSYPTLRSDYPTFVGEIIPGYVRITTGMPRIEYYQCQE